MRREFAGFENALQVIGSAVTRTRAARSAAIGAVVTRTHVPVSSRSYSVSVTFTDSSSIAVAEATAFSRTVCRRRRFGSWISVVWIRQILPQHRVELDASIRQRLRQRPGVGGRNGRGNLRYLGQTAYRRRQ